MGYVLSPPLSPPLGPNQPNRVSSQSRPVTGQHAITDSPSKSLPTSLIDCHVHLAALPEGNNGCMIFSRMLKSPLFRFLPWKHQLSSANPAAENYKYLQDLLRELRASRHVGKAVLLGMDGVYTKDGRLNLQATDFLISNDYVLKQAQEFPNDFLAGIFISPQRIDAIEELHRCAEAEGGIGESAAECPTIRSRPLAIKSFTALWPR